MGIFNKRVEDLRTEDLEQLLADEAFEGVRLEFKSEEVKRLNWLKKISSFANTFGGYIVHGARERNRKLVALPGVGPIDGFDSKVQTWCWNLIYPPVQPRISPAIPAPSNSSKVLYVIHVPESLEAPHFLNDHGGAWVRVGETSQGFKPRYASYEELQHLINRRGIAIARKGKLLNRARGRFAEAWRARYGHHAPGIASPALELSLMPSYPSRTIAQESELRWLAFSPTVQFRGVAFPLPNGVITQFESLIVLNPSTHVDYLELNVWGQAFLGAQVGKASGDRIAISGFDVVGCVLLFLEYCRVSLGRIGFDGPVELNARILGVKERAWMWHRDELRTQPGSRLDDYFQVEIDTDTVELEKRRDELAIRLYSRVFYAHNMAGLVADEPKAARLLGYARGYNNWPDPKSEPD